MNNPLLIKLRQLLLGWKQACYEQLWLVGILTPLLVLAVLGAIRLSKHHQNDAVIDESRAYVVSQAQISPEELSRIVSMPLTDLLNMEVYIEAGSSQLRGDPVMMSALSDSRSFLMRTQELILTNRSRRVRFNMLAYLLNTNNKQAIVGLT